MNTQTATRGKLNSLLIKLSASKLFYIFSFAILTSIAAQVAIPVKPVPFTLQAMAVILSGALLGARNGAYSQMLYLALGIIGLPVFAAVPDATYGITRLMGPTGGYLLAFPIAAFVTGMIVEKYKKYWQVILAMFAGSFIIIASGVLFLNTFFLHNINEALIAGASLFSVWTVVKVLAAAGIYFAIKKNK